MKKIILILIGLTILVSNNRILANEFFIKFKVDNEIITNIDIQDEVNYLLALNPPLKKLDKLKIENLATKSIIKEKIKKIELDRYYKLNGNENNDIVEKITNDLFLKAGFDTKKKILNHLRSVGLNYEWIKKKIKIETYWNNLIFKKYEKQTNVKVASIKKDLEEQLNSIKKKRKLFLSEILVRFDQNQNIQNQKKKILNSIDEVGFENTAAIYSISGTAKTGGKVDWVVEDTLSKEIQKFVKKLDKNQISEFIKINNNYLLLKIDDVQEINQKYDFEKILNKRIALKKNQQLEVFSSIYFEKIKQDIIIDEK